MSLFQYGKTFLPSAVFNVGTRQQQIMHNFVTLSPIPLMEITRLKLCIKLKKVVQKNPNFIRKEISKGIHSWCIKNEFHTISYEQLLLISIPIIKN
jgi:hypothetical protein